MSKTTASPSRTGIYVGLAVVVVVALGAAIFLSQPSADTAAMPLDATVTVSGDPLPGFEGDPATDAGIGRMAPGLTGQDFDGNQITITNDGRPKVVLFLAHWCPHCQREVPVLQDYSDEIGFPDSVDIYSVATSYSSTQPNWPPSAWLEREGWTFPTIVDDPASTAFLAFGQGNFPYYVLIDSNGQVALRMSGAQDAATLADQLLRLADL
ncbi:MAG TPA: TlpA disulfide reductase family protein [Acidimicrobiia bacterium]|nr:TlpA disulfide reductase family protein [Acidimicrobiia bacterium]